MRELEVIVVQNENNNDIIVSCDTAIEIKNKIKLALNNNKKVEVNFGNLIVPAIIYKTCIGELYLERNDWDIMDNNIICKSDGYESDKDLILKIVENYKREANRKNEVH